MSRLKLSVLLLLIITIICAASVTLPLIFFRQMPHFSRYEDTRLLEQRTYAAFDDVTCQLTLFHKQTFETTHTSDSFWERLPSSWQDEGHEFLGYHDLAKHRYRINQAATINNNISLLRQPTVNQIFTSNSATAHLPNVTCQLLPLRSGFYGQE